MWILRGDPYYNDLYLQHINNFNPIAHQPNNDFEDLNLQLINLHQAPHQHQPPAQVNINMAAVAGAVINPPGEGRVWRDLTAEFIGAGNNEKLWFPRVYGRNPILEPTDLTPIETIIVLGTTQTARQDAHQHRFRNPDDWTALFGAECFLANMAVDGNTMDEEHGLNNIYAAVVAEAARVRPFAGNLLARPGIPANVNVLPDRLGWAIDGQLSPDFGVAGHALVQGVIHYRMIPDAQMPPGGRRHFIKAYAVWRASDPDVIPRATIRLQTVFCNFLASISQRGSATQPWVNRRNTALANELEHQNVQMTPAAIRVLWNRYTRYMNYTVDWFNNLIEYMNQNQEILTMQMWLCVTQTDYKGLAAFNFARKAFESLAADSFAWAALLAVVGEEQFNNFRNAAVLIGENPRFAYTNPANAGDVKATNYPDLAYFGIQYQDRVMNNREIRGYAGVGSRPTEHAGMIDRIIQRLAREKQNVINVDLYQPGQAAHNIARVALLGPGHEFPLPAHPINLPIAAGGLQQGAGGQPPAQQAGPVPQGAQQPGAGAALLPGQYIAPAAGVVNHANAILQALHNIGIH